MASTTAARRGAVVHAPARSETRSDGSQSNFFRLDNPEREDG
ncbi:hypothetical protein [Agrococcus sp. HG114]|nr:hypothetical protein [Agrococcus sp. HG114]MCR8669978.1 hypothetical protein [Agrococcus sp. HG114]